MTRNINLNIAPEHLTLIMDALKFQFECNAALSQEDADLNEEFYKELVPLAEFLGI